MFDPCFLLLLSPEKISIHLFMKMVQCNATAKYAVAKSARSEMCVVTFIANNQKVRIKLGKESSVLFGLSLSLIILGLGVHRITNLGPCVCQWRHNFTS